MAQQPETRSVRLLRVGEQVRHVLSEVLMRGEVHDDVLASHSVSVTEVRMSPDLRHATVFVKPLLGTDEAAVLKALRTNTAFLQRSVATSVGRTASGTWLLKLLRKGRTPAWKRQQRVASGATSISSSR